MWSPTCRRPTTPSGCAATASSNSPKVTSEPGKIVNLKSVPAPDPKAAAQYYPAIYWYSMLKMPDASQFGPKGIPVKQYEYISLMKNNGCVGCHQLGTLATRTIPAVFGTSSKDAWMQRTQAGQAGELMVNIIAGQLQAAPLGYLADWTDRIAKGELPHATPKRPEGVERNVVVTTYDWSDQQHYLHDLSATDKRNPTVNGYGHLYGQPEYSMDAFPVLDLKTETATLHPAPRRDADMHEMLGPGHAAMEKPLGPSAYWGEEKIWTAHFNNHNATMDDKGRVWMTAAFRDQHNEPAFCKKGSDLVSAKLFPLNESQRMLMVYDPKTDKFEFVDTCFTTHHLNFDKNGVLWTSSGGGGGVVGWVDTKKWDETHDAAESQGWTALVVDTKGDGKRGEYTEPGQPADPNKDRRLGQVFYAVSVNPTDGSVWGTIRSNPGSIVRINPGSNPPRPRCRKSTTFRCRDSDRAAVISIRRASIGHRSQAAIWAPSIAPSARVRSTDRMRPATNARRAGASTSIRGRALRASARTAPSRATIPGSTSTTRSGSATIRRSPPPTSRTASPRCTTARWCCCACHTRWASSPRGSTDASMIPTAAGKPAACG